MRLKTRLLVGIFLCCSFLLPLHLIATDVTIEVTPIDTVVTLGDSLFFEAYVTNNEDSTVYVDVWFTAEPDTGGSEVLIPAIALCIPNNPQAVTLTTNETRGDTCWLWVPSSEDPGGYTFMGKVGDYVNVDSLVYDEDGFHFTVVE